MIIEKKINILCSIIIESIFNKNYTNFITSHHLVNDELFSIDFLVDEKISINDFSKIEKLINKVTTGALEIKEENINYLEALKLFKDNKYISQIIKTNEGIEFFNLITLNGYKTITLEKLDFNKTNIIKQFKLLSIGGFYWLNDSKNEQLIRLSGVSFSNTKDLELYMIEYQERIDRDHRKIGKDLDLFTFDLLSGQGFPIWLSNGSLIRKEIRNFLYELEFKYDFSPVYTPILGNVDLYKKSGHWDHYQENMFPIIDIETEKLVLRPMTCPHHILIFKKKLYSYKQLPIRLCEESMLHRYESTGGLTGLERVREMVLEDTHIFCSPNQIEEEVLNCYNIINEAHKGLNSEIYQIDLSLHDPKDKEKFHQDEEMWKSSEDSLREMLNKHKIKFVEKIGEAAFYGPKIDFQVKTALNRIITMSTIQLDFLLPEKFELEYKDKDGNNKRPIMIHLGIIGTYERLLSIILEQTKGILPLWLSPIQVMIIPVNNEIHSDFARLVYSQLKKSMIRVKLDDRDERMSKKIREAQISKILYQVIIGDSELENKELSIRKYGSEETNIFKIEEFNNLLVKQIIEKK